MDILKEIVAKYRTNQQAGVGDVCAWWSELTEVHISIGTIVNEATYEEYVPDWVADILIGSDKGGKNLKFCTQDDPPIVLSCTIKMLQEEYPEVIL